MTTQVFQNLLMRYGVKLGLSPQEKDLLWQLLDHDFDGKESSWPGFTRLCDRIGITTRKGMSELICRVEATGLIKVIRTTGRHNSYDFSALCEKLAPFLEQEGKRILEKSASRTKETTINHKVNSEQATMHQQVNSKQKDTINIEVNSNQEETFNYLPESKQSFVHYLPQGNTNSFPPLSVNRDNQRGGDLVSSRRDFVEITEGWWRDRGSVIWMKNVAPKLKHQVKHPGILCGDSAHASLVALFEKNLDAMGIDGITERYENYTKSDYAFYLEKGYSLYYFCKDFLDLVQPRQERKKNASNGESHRKFIPGQILRYTTPSAKFAGTSAALPELRTHEPY